MSDRSDNQELHCERYNNSDSDGTCALARSDTQDGYAALS